MATGIVSSLPPPSIAGLSISVALSLLCYQFSIYVYNFWFHPLANYPGPKLAAVSCIPRIRRALRGDVFFWIVDLHLQYGEVVRVSPNELSFSGADAWKDVYGHKKAGQPNLVKDPAFYSFGEDDPHLVVVNDEDHARQRRIFANAFSDRALKMQEPLFNTYVDKLVRKLRATIASKPDEKFNMVNMYNL